MALRSRPFLGSLLLALLVLGLFGRAATFDFVNYDDNEYVYDNPRVKEGITPGGAWWGLTDISSGNWHPLTWWSHMLDVQLFGLRPGWHHLTSVLLHMATTVLTFLLLRALTGSFGASLMVAALFGVHPLHIQSVAWIAERKDVLSGLCFALTLWAYVRYLRVPGKRAYAAVLGIYLVGLMAKPMLVTLPLVMLLIDWWPLDRFRDSSAPRRLILEKAPLGAMATASMFITYAAQKSGHSVRSLARYPIGDRVANAFTSYAAYLGKMFLPTKLAVFYPLPPQPNPRWWAFLAVLGLAVVTAAAVAGRRRRPYLPMGWFWYLVMLLPVIGLIQVGDQSMADRYTYLPLTGLFIAAVWGISDLSGARPRGAAAASALGVLVLAALVVVSWKELAYWRDSAPLMARAIEITKKNYVAENNYGSALVDNHRMREAVPHLEAAIRLRREYHAISPEAHHNLGVALLTLGRYEEAAENFRASLHPRPDDLDTRLNLGAALMALGRYEEAAVEFRRILHRDPGFVKARENLTLAESRMLQAAPSEGRGFHGGSQDRALTQLNTAITCLQAGDVAGAVRHLESALQMRPGFQEAQRLLDKIRGTRRD